MSGHKQRKGAGFLYRYRCNAQGGVGQPRCGAVLSRRLTEERVEAAVRDKFSDPAKVRALLEQPETDDAETQLKLAEIEHESAEAFNTWRKGYITGDELGMVRAELSARRAALLATHESITYPVEEYMDAAQGLEVREILALFNLVATVTREDISLGVG